MNLLEACIKADNCQGGTIHQFLPFVETRANRIARFFSDTGKHIGWFIEVSIWFKGDCLKSFETIDKDFDLKTFDINSIEY